MRALHNTTEITLRPDKVVEKTPEATSSDKFTAGVLDGVVAKVTSGKPLANFTTTPW